MDYKGTPYENFGPKEWALEFIASYGQIDGAHHKAWVLDQVARILHGTPVKIDKIGGHYYFTTGDPSPAYLEWVKQRLGLWIEEQNEYEYCYDPGIAP